MNSNLPISIGIVAWHSGQTLVDTLATYYDKNLLENVNDVTILFQEFSEEDSQIANHFGIPYLQESHNIGIGNAFEKLCNNAKSDNVMLLEHDWHLVEPEYTVLDRLQSGLNLLSSGVDVVRYRHRAEPGYPHFSFRHKGNELNYYDEWSECTCPHLIDSLHWLDPDKEFPDKVQKQGEYFITTSRYANWTNNPFLVKKHFYLKNILPFNGKGIALEQNIAKWWARKNFKVAHGEGLFKHVDIKKYGR